MAYKYIDNSGIIVPDTSDTLSDVQNEYRAAFGQDLDVSPETPQGVLIAAETSARQTVIENNAAVANQINPNLAEGIFLDAIWALTGGARVKATPSILRGVIMTGRPSTIIPAGARASVGISGAVFALISSVIIGKDGQVTGDYQSIDLGPVAVSVNGLNTIVTGILGWETVKNPAVAELGKESETDQAARTRRRLTLGLQGVALPEAIVSGLYAVEGVRSLVFLENTTSEPITVDTVTLVAHSIYVCVDGGGDQDVAWALLQKKSLGCGWNGAITVDVLEPVSGQTYPVQFDRPSLVTIYAKITARNTSGISDPANAIRDAVLSYANGDMEDEPGFTVGNNVSAFELGGAINRVYPSIYVAGVELSTDGQNFSCNEIPIKPNQKANIIRGAIEVILS